MYRFSFHVNPTDLIELDARLGDIVLHDPLKAKALFRSVSNHNYIRPEVVVSECDQIFKNVHLLFIIQVCFLSIKTLSLLDHIHTESQVNYQFFGSSFKAKMKWSWPKI